MKALWHGSLILFLSLGSLYDSLLVRKYLVLEGSWAILFCPNSSPDRETNLVQSSSVQFSLVAQSRPTLCEPMDCSTPGFLVHQQLLTLLKLMSVESVMPSNHLILCQPLSFCLQSFPASGSFLMSRLLASGGQSIGVSASASVLQMNIQGWFPLWIDWFDLLATQGILKSLLQYHNSKASVLQHSACN